jgi:hypothetical protein
MATGKRKSRSVCLFVSWSLVAMDAAMDPRAPALTSASWSTFVKVYAGIILVRWQSPVLLEPAKTKP